MSFAHHLYGFLWLYILACVTGLCQVEIENVSEGINLTLMAHFVKSTCMSNNYSLLSKLTILYIHGHISLISMTNKSAMTFYVNKISVCLLLYNLAS